MVRGGQRRGKFYSLAPRAATTPCLHVSAPLHCAVETTKIITNVVNWLEATPTGRFIQVETSFLQRWWVDQAPAMRARFTALLQTGRLELVGGGWTMHDEESTSVYSALTNMEYGLTWLERTFGAAYRPRILWQIDPSGHAL